jgi:hypothetical protein
MSVHRASLRRKAECLGLLSKSFAAKRDGSRKLIMGDSNGRGEQNVVSPEAARGKLNQMSCAQLIEKVQGFQQDIGSTATAADKNFAGTFLHFGAYSLSGPIPFQSSQTAQSSRGASSIRSR